MELLLPFWALALLPLLVLLAAIFWGAPPMALLSEIFGMLTGKPFPIRCGQQLSRLAIKGHIFFWIVVLGAVGVALAHPSEYNPPVFLMMVFFPIQLTAHPDWIAFWNANPLPISLALLMPICGTLLLAAYDLRWKQAREHRGMHVALGCLASVAIKYGYWALAVLSTLFFLGAPAESIPALSSPLWPFFTLWFPLSLQLAAACALLNLVLRREIDAWGRDYYRFAAPYLSVWHIVSGCCALLWYLWLWMSARQTMNLFLPQIFYPWLVSIACLILSWPLSLAVRGSDNPMRLKGCMIGTLLLAYVQVLALIVAVWEAMSHYLPGWSLPTFMPSVLQMLRG